MHACQEAGSTQGWASGNWASSAREASPGPGHRPQGLALAWGRIGRDKPSGLQRLPGAELDQVGASHAQPR